VAVAAYDGHTREGETTLRAYYMNYTVARVKHAIVGEAKVFGILSQSIDLLLADGVLDGLVLIVCGRIVVGHAVDMVGAEALEASPAQSGKCLRAGHLVAVETVDIELRRSVFDDLYDVLVPDFVK
jgi:hypothetical protein